MKQLVLTDIFGARYYRFNVAATVGYLGGNDNSIAAAPLIHTYSAQLEAVSTRLALKKQQSSIWIGTEEYTVNRFLTVQSLNNAFFKDEGGEFRPNVKPHYALAPKNGKGSVYRAPCKTLLSIGDNIIYNGQQSVHAHDKRVSPKAVIDALDHQLQDAFQKQSDLFITSYVIDHINKQVIVTEHCLLTEKNHDQFFSTLDANPTPTIEALLLRESPIKQTLQRFDAMDTASDFSRISMMLAGDEVQLYSEEIRKQIKQKQLQFNALIAMLKTQTDELEAKGTPGDPTFNHRYINVAKAATTLQQKLTDAGNHPYFTTPTPMALDHLMETCMEAIRTAGSEFKNHRSIWHTMHPFWRGLIGVLAGLTLLPALLVEKKSKHGYTKTFFDKPPTESSKKLQLFTDEMMDLLDEETESTPHAPLRK